MATTFVRARVDEDLKNEAAAVLAGMGLTVSDVVRIALTKIAREKALPFDMRLVRQQSWQEIVDESSILVRNGESTRPRVMRYVPRGPW